MWILLTMAAFGLSMAMLGLFLTSLAYTSRNITKIDILKGTFKLSDPQNTMPNPFDLGVISNFANIFEGNVWTWWLPTEMIGRADGIHFPMRPAISRKDLKELPDNIQ
jgi:hypothetical protein